MFRFRYFFYHHAGQFLTALPSFGPAFGKYNPYAVVAAQALQNLYFGHIVAHETVYSHNGSYAVIHRIADMALQVGETSLHSRRIRSVQVGKRNTSVIFQRAHRSHNHPCLRVQMTGAAFYVHEFLCAHIRTETCLGNDIFGKRKPRKSSYYGVSALCYIGKRPSVEYGRAAVERLN